MPGIVGSLDLDVALGKNRVPNVIAPGVYYFEGRSDQGMIWVMLHEVHLPLQAGGNGHIVVILFGDVFAVRERNCSIEGSRNPAVSL